MSDKKEETKPQEPKEELTEKELLEYYKAKYETINNEFKSVIKQRDDYKNQFDSLSVKTKQVEVDPNISDVENKKKAELMLMVQRYSEENKALQDKLLSIENEKVVSNKKNVLYKVAKEYGVKQHYIENNLLDKLVDFGALELDEKNFHAQMMIDDIKKKYPDMFGSSGQSGKAPLPSSLSSQNVSSKEFIQAQYDQAFAKYSQSRKLEDRQELMKIASMADEAGINLTTK